MARLFQASTIAALEKGHYDYTISIEYFMRNGDTGIGTYNGHNGEAIFLDGVAYNGCASGEVKVMDYPQTGVTFGAITKFNSEVPEFKIENVTDLETLKRLLNEQCLTLGPNYFYVARIHGHFNDVTVCSSYKQRKPFRPLDVVRKEMRSYTYKDLDGLLVAIYAPKYLGNVSFNGWCFHFLSDDKLKGGKITKLSAPSLRVKINSIDKWEIKLPNSKGFMAEPFSDESVDSTEKSEAEANPTKEDKKVTEEAPAKAEKKVTEEKETTSSEVKKVENEDESEEACSIKPVPKKTKIEKEDKKAEPSQKVDAKEKDEKKEKDVKKESPASTAKKEE